MSLCLSCWLRKLSIGKLALLIVFITLFLIGSHAAVFLLGRTVEQAKLAPYWQKIADSAWNLRPHRP